VVERSQMMPWYGAAPLLYHLEHVVIASDRNLTDVRFPVQWVIRPNSHEHHDYRGYAGQVAGGVLRPGSEIVVLPGGHRTRIASIDTQGGDVEVAFPTMSVAVRLADQLDVSRGDMIVEPEDQPIVSRELDAMICWMAEQPMTERGRYMIKHTTRSARVIAEQIEHRVDVNSLGQEPASQLGLNEIGRVRLRCSTPLMVDPYSRNRTTGSFILIDETSNDTVGAGMVVGAR
jgi:sulfate adenylyltransferase subunit 1 (EFTu-like GTPase family)